MKTKPTVLMGVFLIILSAIPLVAHHSFATQYDTEKAITLKGSVMMLDLVNPHSWLYINVKDAKGALISWGIELGPIRDLQVQGWDKTTIKPGTEVAIEGFPAKNGSKTLSAKSVRLADGKTLFATGSGMAPQTKK
jgi:Family of unknown function (DUF6152)